MERANSHDMQVTASVISVITFIFSKLGKRLLPPADGIANLFKEAKNQTIKVDFLNYHAKNPQTARL